MPFTIDEDWAKELGFEDLAELKATFAKRFTDEYKSMSRTRLKRALLDRLAADYAFAVPEGMVDLEFEAIWKQLTDEMERTGDKFGEDGKSEDELKAEYRSIAERRVRLGLILSDLGTRNEVQVEGEELQQAVMREAMRYPGQERKVIEFFKGNPGALEQLRAPLFEDKVCDFIFEQVKLTDQPVSIEELMKDPDDEAEAAPVGRLSPTTPPSRTTMTVYSQLVPMVVEQTAPGRARLRHLLADAQGAHRLPDGPGRRRRRQPGHAQLLFLEAENPDKDIMLYINSPGRRGHGRARDLRHDAVHPARRRHHLHRPGGVDGLAAAVRRCHRQALRAAARADHDPPAARAASRARRPTSRSTPARSCRPSARLNEIYVRHTGQTLDGDRGATWSATPS